MAIDVHSHIEITAAFDLLPEAIRSLQTTSPRIRELSEKESRDQLSNPEVRIAEMTKAGISLAILSNAPGQFYYNLEGKLGIIVSRKINDEIASLVKKYPDKFLGMATVPLQNVQLAVLELERAVKDLKLCGVHVSSNVMGKYLGDPVHYPFLEKAAELGVPVFVHPTNVAGADRLKPYYFQNLIGNPLDTTIAAGTLIFSGIFDRLPQLKVVLAHAGGFLPYNVDRWQHGSEVRPECRDLLKRPVATYLRNFFFDTISHGPESLRFLVSRVGADRVVMGTDFPYDMGDLTPVQSVQAAKLPVKDMATILSKNCLALFNIS